MRNTERRAKLKRSMLIIQAVLADESLADRIFQAMGGYPSTTYGRMTSRSHGSPVEGMLGLNDQSDEENAEDEAKGFRLRADDAQAALDELDRLVKRITDDTDALDDLRRSWPPLRHGTVAKSDEPGCELCRREKRWTAPKGEPTTVDGVLPRPYLLCSTCIRLVANVGRIPKPKEYHEAHSRGRVKVKAS